MKESSSQHLLGKLALMSIHVAPWYLWKKVCHFVGEINEGRNLNSSLHKQNKQKIQTKKIQTKIKLQKTPKTKQPTKIQQTKN